MMPVPRDIRRRSPVAADWMIYGMPPLLRRIYQGRGVTRSEQLDYALTNLYSYEDLSGIDGAVTRLVKAIEEQQRILVVADYDADGATACAIAVRTLGALGSAPVSFLVPDRMRHGYGLSPELVDLALQQDPQLIITVDNGISSVAGVDRANDNAVDVVITDHHLPGDVLPRATAIVNPNLPGDGFPSKSLAGVGVMFYLLAAVRTRLRERGWFREHGIEEPNIADCLPLVALGTVADLVALDFNNRLLVAQGLRRIRAGHAAPGLLALLQVAGRDATRTTATDLGFAVGPRLNAAGRLSNMDLGIDCLLTDSQEAAATMARALDRVNQERRVLQAQMQNQADAGLQVLGALDSADQTAGLCLFHESWHPGVVGLIASRVKDRLQRPVVAFAPENGDMLKGSGRSVSTIHLRDALANIAAANPHLIQRFGGHAMAAGLSMSRQHLAEFSLAFAAEIERLGAAVPRCTDWISDGELSATDLTLQTAAMLAAAGPWGQGFPEPLFDGEFLLLSARVVGATHLQLSLRHPGRPEPLAAIAFNQAQHHGLTTGRAVRLVYRLSVNEFAGRRSLQLIVEQLQAID